MDIRVKKTFLFQQSDIAAGLLVLSTFGDVFFLAD